MYGPEKIRRRELFERWKDWPACLALAHGREEKEIFERLVAQPKDQVRALRKLPQEEISMRYSSFQSHLWNELLRAVVRDTVGEPTAVAGIEGDYLYWTGAQASAAAPLLLLDLPTCAARMTFSDDRTRDLFAGILASRGLKLGDFRTRALQRVYFKSFPSGGRQARAAGHPRAADGRAHPGRATDAVVSSSPRVVCHHPDQAAQPRPRLKEPFRTRVSRPAVRRAGAGLAPGPDFGDHRPFEIPDPCHARWS